MRESLRMILAPIVGQRLVEITDGPAEDSLEEAGNVYVYFHFGNGWTLRVGIDEVEGMELLEP